MIRPSSYETVSIDDNKTLTQRCGAQRAVLATAAFADQTSSEHNVAGRRCCVNMRDAVGGLAICMGIDACAVH